MLAITHFCVCANRAVCGALNIKLLWKFFHFGYFFLVFHSFYGFYENRQKSCPVCMQLPSFDIKKDLRWIITQDFTLLFFASYSSSFGRIVCFFLSLSFSVWSFLYFGLCINSSPFYTTKAVYILIFLTGQLSRSP